MAKSLKILYLAHELESAGGVQFVSKLTLRALDCMEHEKLCQYRFIIFQGGNADAKGIHWLAKGSRLKMYFLCIWNIFCWRPDLVICDHLFTARFQSWIPYICFTFWAHLIEFDPPMHAMHRRSLSRATSIFCNSNFTLNSISNTYPEVSAKLQKISLGDLPRTAYKHSLYQENLPNQQLMMVGRMASNEQYKGHDEIIEALPLILKKYPALHIDIIGEGDDRSRLENKVRKLNLSSSITFFGYLSDQQLQNKLDEATGLLLPSKREGFGLVYLEALRRGIPALALKNTVAEEVMGKCGLFVSKMDPSDLLPAISVILNDEWKFAEDSQHSYVNIYQFDIFKERFKKTLMHLFPSKCH